MEINSKDISVIVQGHVRGLSTDPYEERWTYLSLESIRRYLPESEIILSTFKDCDVRDMPYDILVQSDDPGFLDLGKDNRFLANTNRQIVSSRAGLNRASRKYALKMRYDLVLEGADFLAYFDVFNERMDAWKILKKRIISCTSISLNPKKFGKNPYAPSDWFHFGLLEDVTSIWDIPLIPPAEGVKSTISEEEKVFEFLEVHLYSAEQYLWVSFLRKHGEIHFSHSRDLSNNSVELTEQTIVNNIVLLEPEQIPVKCKKYENKNHLTYSKRLNYTHAEWLGLYEKYCLKKYLPVSSSLEGVRYSPIPKDDTPVLNDSLFELSREVIKGCADVHFDRLNDRLDSESKCRIHTCPGENYKLLAALIGRLDPRYVVEIGTGNGLAALCTKAYMTKPSLLLTINHDNHGWDGPVSSNLNEKDFNQGELIQMDIDISLPKHLETVITRIADADIIRFNLADGLLLRKILDPLERTKNDCPKILVIENIRLLSMAVSWHEISMPRIDLTSFGHAYGFGLVYCAAGS